MPTIRLIRQRESTRQQWSRWCQSKSDSSLFARVVHQIIHLAGELKRAIKASSIIRSLSLRLRLLTGGTSLRADCSAHRASSGRNFLRPNTHVPTIRRDLPISRLALVVIVPRRGRRLGIPALLRLRAWLRLIDGLPFGIPTLVNRLSPRTGRKPGQQQSQNPFHCAPLRCWARIYLQIGRSRALWSAPCRCFRGQARGVANHRASGGRLRVRDGRNRP